MKRLGLCAALLLAVIALTAASQSNDSDEGGRVLALEKAGNLAIEKKDAKALGMLLDDTLVSVDTDGSKQNKKEFLAAIAAPGGEPAQTVIEQTSVQVYGNAAVVVGILRIKGMEKGKPYQHRERFVDTWIKSNNTWQCVATASTLISAKD
jgi:ketosteroid isomerase-like protein